MVVPACKFEGVHIQDLPGIELNWLSRRSDSGMALREQIVAEFSRRAAAANRRETSRRVRRRSF